MEPPLRFCRHTCHNLSGSSTGGGRSRSTLTKLKIVVLAAMPSVSDDTATAVKPGFFNSWRKANLRSFITQRLHRIDSACSPGGPPASEDRNNQECPCRVRFQ